MRKILTLFLTGLLMAISLSTPASGASIAEYKSCVTPGQSKNGLACIRGLDGKLLWVTSSSINLAEPGTPLYRTCSTAGDRRVLKFWSGDPGYVVQDQFGCLTLTAQMIKDIKSENKKGCVIVNWSYGAYEEEKASCAFGKWKIGQKVWWFVPGGFPYKNIVPGDKVADFPAEEYVTKDTPEIPSCYLDQTCGEKEMDRYANVIAMNPNTIIHPAKNKIQPGSNPTMPSTSSQSTSASCSTISGSGITINYEYGSLTFTNPFACKITLQISGQINCKATWVPIPVSASISMSSKESKNLFIGGVFPNALATCKSFMTLNRLAYDGSGGLTTCTSKSCLNSFRFTGRVS